MIRVCMVGGLIFDLAADTSLTVVLVCLATVKTGEVSNGPTQCVTQPHPAEEEAIVTCITVLYKLLHLHTLYFSNT